MAHAEQHASRVAAAERLARFHDRRARAHHVVEDDDVFAGETFERDGRIGGHLDLDAPLARAFFRELADAGFGQRDGRVHLLDELDGAFVGSAEHEPRAAVASLDDVGAREVVGVELDGHQVLEIAAERRAEDVLHRMRMVVHRDHRVDARHLEQLRVEQRAEGLAVELAEIFRVARVGRAPVLGPRPTVLRGVKKIGLDEDDLGRAVVLGRSCDQEIALRQRLSAVLTALDGDDDDRRALEPSTDVGQVGFVAQKARAELAVREVFERNDVRQIGGLAERVADIDGERVFRDVADDDDASHGRRP